MSHTRAFFILILVTGCAGPSEVGEDAGSAADGSAGGEADASFEMPPLGSGVSTLAGRGDPGLVDGERGEARFHNPVNVAVGPDRQVYIADFDNGLVRVATPAGTVSTLAGGSAGFARPFGLAFAADGALYVQTDFNAAGDRGGALWKIAPASGGLELIADDVGRPRGLAAVSNDRLVLVDYVAHDVRLMDLATRQATLLAGAPGEPGFANGQGASARFHSPYDVVVTREREIIVSDQANHCLRKISLDGSVTTFAGTGERGVADGDRLEARFDQPQGLALDGAGNIYVSSRGGYVIRKIDAAGDVTTIAGAGVPGYRDSEDPRSAEFFGLEGLDVTPEGDFVYISDGNRGESDPHHRVRRLSQ